MDPVADVTTHQLPDEPFAPRLLEPSLENRLRVVGRFVDSQRFHTIALSEVDSGFLVRAYPDVGSVSPVILEFPDSEFPRLVQEAVASRGEFDWARPARSLVPTGYEDLLRALGRAFDQKAAENVTVTEFPSFIAVSGFAPVIESECLAYEPFSDALDHVDVQALLEMAIGKRGTYSPVTSYYPPGLRGTERD